MGSSGGIELDDMDFHRMQTTNCGGAKKNVNELTAQTGLPRKLFLSGWIANYKLMWSKKYVNEK